MSTGVSGDMFEGAMIDAGFPLSRIQEALHGLGLEGVRVEARRVTRCGLGGTKFDVVEEREVPSPLSSSPELGRRQGADHRTHPHGLPGFLPHPPRFGHVVREACDIPMPHGPRWHGEGWAAR